ncbi:hypothetical protein ABDD95_19490 [Mucilaginibacter sp. PAMB04274]|uniref:hypothetical protein n=1 Tax=Mucilaginibacter sp. PAMB04274 TaxID=3138568 RepID=UPI0031F711A5
MLAKETIYIQKDKVSGRTLSAKEKAIDYFFSNIYSSQVEEELCKWFFFRLTGRGRHIIDLTADELIQFANELPRLITLIYNYQHSSRKGGSNAV